MVFREWDYLFNYRENGEHKTCQYKILFDKDKNAQSFFWLPEGCGPKKSAPEVVREVINSRGSSSSCCAYPPVTSNSLNFYKLKTEFCDFAKLGFVIFTV